MSTLLAKPKQGVLVKDAVQKFLEQGMTNKNEIYDKVVTEYNIPRPTVRKHTNELLAELKEKVAILEPKKFRSGYRTK